MDQVKVFCIDGVIIEIDREQVTREALERQALMPIEDQPIMAGHLSHLDVELLSPMEGAEACDKFDGRMIQDRNTETFGEVAESLNVPDYPPKDWP